jgi:hypothetical protein
MFRCSKENHQPWLIKLITHIPFIIMLNLMKNVSFPKSSKLGTCTRNYSSIIPKCETPLGFLASATCKLPSYNRAGHGFESFYVALSNHYSVLLTTTHRVQSLSLVLNLYLSISVALSTNFSQHLTGFTTKTSYPAFLSYYIVQVTNSVHSRIKNGSLTGSTVFEYTTLDHFKVLEKSMGLVKDEDGNFVSFSLSNGLENTPLSALSLSDFVKVHDNVRRFSESTSEGTVPQICDKVLFMYQSLHMAFHPSSRLVMTDDIHFDRVSTNLGIFRYHSYNGMWLANCYSLDKVSDHGISMQYSFIGLFNPDISYSMLNHADVLSREPQPGDRLIDLSDISSVDYWKTMMSGGAPQPTKTKKENFSASTKAPMRDSGTRSFSTSSRRDVHYSSVYYSRLKETVYYTLEDKNAVLLHSKAFLYY